MLQVGVELGDHGELDVELTLDDVTECHVVREPELVASLHKLPIATISEG